MTPPDEHPETGGHHRRYDRLSGAQLFAISAVVTSALLIISLLLWGDPWFNR